MTRLVEEELVLLLAQHFAESSPDLILVPRIAGDEVLHVHCTMSAQTVDCQAWNASEAQRIQTPTPSSQTGSLEQDRLTMQRDLRSVHHEVLVRLGRSVTHGHCCTVFKSNINLHLYVSMQDV
jgi:hypothetical protein